MNQSNQQDRLPSHEEMEGLFVNNWELEAIGSYLTRFNPIKTMKMERMEIRHSAILAWLLDPSESHGLGDIFLKAFLAEAFRGHRQSDITALDISQSNLLDAEIRCEWQNIDIFILSQSNNWAFIIENKFDSRQGEEQLKGYMDKMNTFFSSEKDPLILCGVFLTLWDEEPNDPNYAPIKYAQICELLENVLERRGKRFSSEVQTFISHYLEILKDATGMNHEMDEMEKLARQLYRQHKKVLDFVIEHGASTDFALAAHTHFGDNPEHLANFRIGEGEYVFSALGSDIVSMLPLSWYQSFGQKDNEWPGCEKWWAGYPLITWFQIWKSSNDLKGTLSFYAEVGPYKFRKELIDAIQEVGRDYSGSIGFQRNATDENRKYSKFFKKNSVQIKDVQNLEEISMAMEKMLNKFQSEFEAIAKVLPQFINYQRAEQEH